MGGKTQTTTSTNTGNSSQSYAPAGLSQLSDIWNKVQGVASQPYTPYGGQLVADLNPVQQSGINNINNAAGSAQPYFNQAANYATTGAAQIDPNNIQRYMSPYTQNVVDATQAQFNNSNAEQQQQVTGNAAMRGALGGDRVGVAQGELARQQKLAQDPVIAGLYNNSYGQALGAAQQDRSAAAQGAYTFGALAPSIQNAQIQGGQAQIGAGSVAQGNQQNQLSAAYNQYLQALAFPYQQAGFLSSAGLPAVQGMGGTQSGTQSGYGTQTKPGPNLIGQIAGLGLAGAGLFSGNPSAGSFGNLLGFGSGATDSSGNPGANSIYGSNPFTPYGATNPAYSYRGGRIGYAFGGDVVEPGQPSPFDRFPAAGEINVAPPQAPASPSVPLPRPRPYGIPDDSAELPQNATSAEGQGSPYSAPNARDGSGAPGEQIMNPRGGSGPSGGLSDDVRMALIRAGLGMAASHSPFALTQIGEGGLQGIESYQKSKEKAQDRQIVQQRADQEASRLVQQADQYAKDFGLREKTLAETIKRNEVPTGFRKDKDGNLQAVPGGPHDPTVIEAETKAKRVTGMSDTAEEVAARQMAEGDMSPLTNYGKGAQGPDNINRLRNKMTEILVNEQGMSPTAAAAYVAAKTQDYKATGIGKSAEARTAGVREANLSLILRATEAAIPAALEASENVARTGWVPLNKIIQKGEVTASNPELRRFGMANLQLAEHWARAMNPTGVMRESDRDKALSFLETADSKDTYRQVVDQLHKQILRERDAVRGERGNAGAAPAAPVPKVGERKQFKQGWGVWDGTQYVPEKQ